MKVSGQSTAMEVEAFVLDVWGFPMISRSNPTKWALTVTVSTYNVRLVLQTLVLVVEAASGICH